MSENTKNRGWVKDVAIAFLAILLVLTFFSNTILNRSLPEVSAKEAGSGSITAQVRGTGTVTADGTYQVKAPSTREIRAVMVKAGQTVEAGDVLFVLGSGDSEELEAAEDKLRELKVSYDKTAASNTGTDTSAMEARAARLVEQLNEATDQLNLIKDTYEESVSDEYVEQLNAARAKLTEANDNLTTVYAETTDVIAQKTNEVNDAQLAYTKAQNDVTLAQETYDNTAADPEATEEEIAEAQQSLLTATETMIAAESTLREKEQALDEENAKVTAAKELVDQRQEEYDHVLTTSNAYSSDYVAAKDKVDDLTETLDEIYASLNSAYASAGSSAAITWIELEDLQAQIDKQEKLIEELSGGGENQIVAEVGGTVNSVTITAGNTAKKGDVICELEVPDSGYSLTFSVTNDQAKRLHVGDVGTVSNFYWGSTIYATLSSMVRDPKNPTTNMQLTFDLDGDVAAGKELTVSIGTRSATYDIIVPNSAIKTDSNGTFVLAITEKSSPLGNRYIASRVPVEVLAKDDTNTAVTGELESGTFVITTSSKPVSAGDQVRFAD